MQSRCDTRTNRVNRPHHLGLWQRSGVHLKGDPGDAPECGTVAENLVDHFVRAPNQQRAVRTSLRVEACTRHGRPAALLADICHRFRVPGEEGVGSLLRGLADIALHMDADLELIRGMPVLPAGFSVEIDQRPKSARLAADDRHHQRKSERAGARERLRRAADAKPDR